MGGFSGDWRGDTSLPPPRHTLVCHFMPFLKFQEWCIAWLAPHLKFFQPSYEEKINTPDSFVKAKKAPRKLPSCFQQGMGESGLPDMTFGGKVYYCSHRDDCNFICNQLRYVHINNQPDLHKERTSSSIVISE